MINFKSRQTAIQQAEILEKHLVIYPHTSVTGLKSRIDNLSPRKDNYDKYSQVKDRATKLWIGLNNMLNKNRKLILANQSLFFLRIIESFKNLKIANCGEMAELAKLIGKINGQENIYTGKVFFRDNKTNEEQDLKHSIVFITNQEIDNDEKYDFHNKQAVIIDPWLGISDFAPEYFVKLKTIYRNKFNKLPNYDSEMNTLKDKSRTIEEYKQRRKSEIPDIKFRIAPHNNISITPRQLLLFKLIYPELVIDNNKAISLDA